jgi:hypothetical protein
MRPIVWIHDPVAELGGHEVGRRERGGEKLAIEVFGISAYPSISGRRMLLKMTSGFAFAKTSLVAGRRVTQVSAGFSLATP